MLNYSVLDQAYELGVHIDLFGQFLQKGDTVLCKGYGSTDRNNIATIKRINPKTIVIEVHKST